MDSTKITKPVRVFISYRHADTQVMKDLRTSLGWLENNDQITVFNDRKILAGDTWDQVIKEQLRQADIIILVVTAKFMASPYCTQTELRQALDRRRKDGTRIIPIIAEHVDWQRLPISDIAALPKDDENNLKPLNKWRNNKDLALAQIAKQVRKNVERLRAVTPSCNSQDSDGFFSNSASDVQVQKKPSIIIVNESHETAGMERLWQNLVKNIAAAKCTPILGAQSRAPFKADARKVAESLVQKYNPPYPFRDGSDLARVSKYIDTICEDKQYLRDRISEILDTSTLIKSKDSLSSIHQILARLPIPLYLTSNLDNLMFSYIKKERGIEARIHIPQWRGVLGEHNHSEHVSGGFPWTNEKNSADPSIDTDDPTVEKPIIFHLCGCREDPESMVLSDDDHRDLLLAIGLDCSGQNDVHQRPKMIPHYLRSCIIKNQLLLIGFRLYDRSLGVLLRLIKLYRRNAGNVAVQPIIAITDENGKRYGDKEATAREYIERYFRGSSCAVMWLPIDAFVDELERHWDNYKSKEE